MGTPRKITGQVIIGNAVVSSPAGQVFPPDTNLSMASHKLTNLTNPTSPQDAATKSYVDNHSSVGFPSFNYTTAFVAAGGSAQFDVDWDEVPGANSALVRHIRVEVSDPVSIYDFKVLRSADPEDLGTEYAFWAVDCQGTFQREFIWDYNDDDATGKVHLWFNNQGPTNMTFTIYLNSRVVQ